MPNQEITFRKWSRRCERALEHRERCRYLGEGSTIDTLTDATGQSFVTLSLTSPPRPVKVRATLGGTTESIVFTLTAT